MKAKTERPTTEPTIAGSSATPLNDEWREEDDLMQNETVKLEKGGRCSRALLSRFENFLYGPLMSPEEKKIQERIICVEECLSSASAAPTSDHNHLFLHRLKRIIFNPDSYGLDEEDPRIGFLCTQLLAAIGANLKLSPSNRRKFVELLDPDGEIANVSTGSPGVKAETPISTRKVPPKSTSPRVPSSHTPETPSRTTTTHKENSVTSLSPSSPHPPPFPSISLSTTHPSLFPSRSSSSPTSPVERIHLTDATMPSSDPFIRPKKRVIRRVTSGRQSSQSSDTASPSMEPASKKRPASGGQSNDMAAPASKRAASGGQSSNSNDIIASGPNHAASGTQSSNSSEMTTPAPKRAASGIQSSGRDNIVAPPRLRSASGSKPFNSEVPKKLWNVFLAKQAHFIPILDLEKLKVTFALAINHGNLEPKSIDPTLGLCVAIACHFSRDKTICEPRKWYDSAVAHIAATKNFQYGSLRSFHQQILQVQYLHMVGNLRMAWETLFLAIGRAQSLRIQTMHGGGFAVDEESLQQMRLVWQFLWMKKLSLALQLGIVDQSFDTFYDPPMPMQSLIENNIGGDQNNRRLAAYSFFVASASLYKHTDQLITVENDLRVTRMECPMKSLSIVDLSGLQNLDRNLFSWNNCLPKFLQWKESGIDLTLEEDSLIRRMCLVTHVKYTYFLLRQYRPFFILCLRLSRSCTCEMAPHIPDKNLNSLNTNPLLGLVHSAAMKCIIAAQDIVKSLGASFDQENDDEYLKSELADYLYAAALVLIASRTSPLSMVQRGEIGGLTRSATALLSQFRRAETLLRKYEECCDLAPEIGGRINRSRNMLDLLVNTSRSHNGEHALISDNEIRLPPVVWLNLYDRLGLEVPFGRSTVGSDSAVPGRRLTFGWLESIPVDFDNEAA